MKYLFKFTNLKNGQTQTELISIFVLGTVNKSKQFSLQAITCAPSCNYMAIMMNHPYYEKLPSMILELDLDRQTESHISSSVCRVAPATKVYPCMYYSRNLDMCTILPWLLPEYWHPN